MAIRIIDTENKVLTGDNCPQLKIGDKCYVVDDRQSTWKKIVNVFSGAAECEDPDREVIKLALGDKAAKEILKDITVKGMENLMYYVIGAIHDMTYDEAKKFIDEKN